MQEVIGNIDPNGAFEKTSQSKLVLAMGALPNWVAQGLHDGCSDIDALVGSLEKSYGFGSLHKFDGGEVSSTGVYQYPEDPPMQPLAVMKTEDLTVWFWQYAMLGIVDNNSGDTFVTRMD
jgi:hypothetical protein